MNALVMNDELVMNFIYLFLFSIFWRGGALGKKLFLFHFLLLFILDLCVVCVVYLSI